MGTVANGLIRLKVLMSESGGSPSSTPGGTNSMRRFEFRRTGFPRDESWLRPPVGSPGLPGRRGAIRSHCESFNTLRIKADLRFSALNQISQQRGIPLKQKYVHRP
jgi:hypothetical protein